MIKKIFKSEFGKWMIILFVMINLSNFLNFLFHFSMGRMLGPVDYGTFAVLMSLMYLYSAPTEAIQNIISRYTTKLHIEKKEGAIKFLMKRSLKKGLTISLLVFLILIPCSLIISKFLSINFWLILLTNSFVFLSFSSPITRGILQGRKKYFKLGISLILDSGVKLFVGVFLVLIGFKVFGAVLGVLFGILIGIISSVYFNKDVLKKEENEISFSGIYRESIPYFISMMVILLIFNLDILLAKRFFSPEIVGKYSVISMLGKMIFFGTTAIGKVMFPLTSEKQDKEENPEGVFKKSFLVISLLCILVIVLFLFFPEIVIRVLYGKQYLDVAPYLVYSGIALSLLSLSNLVLIYGLSINKLRKPYYLFVFLIIEIILLLLFHNNIKEYILAFMASNAIMFIFSFFFVRK